jgi:hypothetical protein
VVVWLGSLARDLAGGGKPPPLEREQAPALHKGSRRGPSSRPYWGIPIALACRRPRRADFSDLMTDEGLLRDPFKPAKGPLGGGSSPMSRSRLARPATGSVTSRVGLTRDFDKAVNARRAVTLVINGSERCNRGHISGIHPEAGRPSEVR